MDVFNSLTSNLLRGAHASDGSKQSDGVIPLQVRPWRNREVRGQCRAKLLQRVVGPVWKVHGLQLCREALRVRRVNHICSDGALQRGS